MDEKGTENAPQIVTMKRRMQPAMIFFLSIAALISIFMACVAVMRDVPDLFLAGLIGFTAAFGFNIPMERGYFIRYDYDTIYKRPHGYKLLYIRRHPVIAMRFEDIGGMSTGFLNNTVHHRAFMTFEVILLHHKDGVSPDILLHPASFTDEAVRDFLHFLRDRNPNIFTPEVTKFLDG
jgi:hypothetical protein